MCLDFLKIICPTGLKNDRLRYIIAQHFPMTDVFFAPRRVLNMVNPHFKKSCEYYKLIDNFTNKYLIYHISFSYNAVEQLGRMITSSGYQE